MFTEPLVKFWNVKGKIDSRPSIPVVCQLVRQTLLCAFLSFVHDHWALNLFGAVVHSVSVHRFTFDILIHNFNFQHLKYQ